MNSFFQTTDQILQKITCYTPEIIGVIGTILGVVLGWILRYISDNKGKIIISIDEYLDRRSNNGEYGYYLIIFIYNNSIKPRYMKNIEIKFFCRKNLFVTNIPRNNISEPDFRYITNEKKIDIVSLCSYDLKKITLCDIIDGKDYNILSKVIRIIMFYENENGKIKKVIIKNNFVINDVSIYTDGEMFPKQ